jgi:hypothetical protein
MAATWAEKQVRALIALGVRPEDAQASVSWALNHVPEDADLDAWVPVADLLVDQLDQAAVQDARGAWYRWTPAQWRRILDAQ